VLSEVGVDGRVEDEVHREVERLKQISDGDGDVERGRLVRRLRLEKVQQFRRNDAVKITHALDNYIEDKKG